MIAAKKMRCTSNARPIMSNTFIRERPIVLARFNGALVPLPCIGPIDNLAVVQAPLPDGGWYVIQTATGVPVFGKGYSSVGQALAVKRAILPCANWARPIRELREDTSLAAFVKQLSRNVRAGLIPPELTCLDGEG